MKKKEEKRALKIIVKDKEEKILTDDELKETVIENELYYMQIQAIRERLLKELSASEDE